MYSYVVYLIYFHKLKNMTCGLGQTFHFDIL